MARPPLERRVSILEEKVEHLEQLPARIDAIELQIVQLRAEMRGEFLALRQEIIGGDEETRGEMRTGFEVVRKEFGTVRKEIVAGDDETRREMRAGFESLRKDIVAGDQETRAEMRAEMRAGFEALRNDIVTGDEETRRFMRVLYEDLVERIATIGSVMPPRRPKR